MKYEIDSSRISFNGEKAKNVLHIISKVCYAINTDFLVVGAFARDLILEHVFETKPGILTRDIDLGIYLGSWNEYQALIDKLISDFGFRKGSKVQEFFSHNDIQLDILPFGEIELNRHLIFPNSPYRMNMMGFREVRASSLEIVIDKEFSIAIPSAEGMILLKLIAWNDRKPHEVTKKHVIDIAMILDAYFHSSLAYISENHTDVFDELLDFDEFFFSAIVIGRDIKKLLTDNQDSYKMVVSIFDEILSDKDNSLFVNQLSSIRKWEYEYTYKVIEYLYSNII